MIKTIDVAGIQLDNYTVRETIMNVEREISDHGFHTIEEVNMDTLMLAESDEVIREALESVEHTVITEKGILDAVGAGSYQRNREIEHHDFFWEMMKRFERNHKTLFLIGNTSEDIQVLQQKILERFPQTRIMGTEALEETQDTVDAVVNEINSLAPDVIISALPSPDQEYFLMENREKLSAGLWYGIDVTGLARPGNRFADGIRNFIRAHKLAKSVNHFNGQQDEN